MRVLAPIALGVSLLLSVLVVPAQSQKRPAASTASPHAVELGHLQDSAITESSGVVASRRAGGQLLWTHNDSGDGPFVYALRPNGAKLGTFRLGGVQTVTDCEDIAIGLGPQAQVPYLYLGDIGDNNSVRTAASHVCTVYRVPEPEVSPGARTSTQAHPILTATAEAFRYVYPDGPHNAESLLVHPRTGCIYVVAKNPNGRDGVYVFPVPLDPCRVVVLKKIATIVISGEPNLYPNLITGGDIAPDGSHVLLRTYWYAYEFAVPAGGAGFDGVWHAKPRRILTPLQAQGEGIGYAYPQGNAFYLTSEGAHTSLYKVSLTR